MITGSRIISCSIHAAFFGFVVGLSTTTVGNHNDLVSSMVMGSVYSALTFFISATFHTLRLTLFKAPSDTCLRLIYFPNSQKDAADSFLLSVKVLFLLAVLALIVWRSNPIMLIEPVIVLGCLYLIYKLDAAGFYAAAAVLILNLLAIFYVVQSFYGRFFDASIGNTNLLVAFVFLTFSARVATVVWYAWKNPPQPVNTKQDAVT